MDEGNNWVNIAWGPLGETDPAGTTLGNYGLLFNSPAINYVTPTNSLTTYNAAPPRDFFDFLRKTNGAVDVGAVEFQAPSAATLSVSPISLAFGNALVGATSAAQTLTLANSGGTNVTGISLAFSSTAFKRASGTAAGSCGTSLAATSTCTIGVVFSPTAAGPVSGTLTITAGAPVSGSPVELSGTGTTAAVAGL